MRQTSGTRARRRCLAPLGALLALSAPVGAESLPRARDAEAPSPARAAAAPQAGATSAPVTPLLVDPQAEAARQALERGLAWLERAQAQGADGAFPPLGARGANAGTGPAATVSGFAPVAVTALGALAWMAGGSAPDRGPHGAACAHAVDWLAGRCELDARSDRYGYVARAGDALSRMHGHGLATLALAQAWSMSPHTERGARLSAALRAAVACIERSQGVEGGWDYEPRKGLSHENSITITAVQALRAAKGAGVDVDRAVIARAEDYVRRTQKEDGSFRYALGDPTSSVALTAAAIATLNATGTYTGRPLEDAWDFLARRLALREDAPGALEGDLVVCPHYERLYLAQALWQHADRAVYETWWRRELPRVLTAQREDGSWRDARFGDVYATAMSCLVLALPEGLLPIFQR